MSSTSIVLSQEPVAVEWREVSGFPGYRVSNTGIIQTCRASNARWGKTKPWTDKKLQYLKSGHAMVTLTLHNKIYLRYVHRLVLEAFVGPCPPGMEGCHEDGDPRNNHLQNLRWDTHKNNLRDRGRHGTFHTGEKVENAKLSFRDVAEIHRLLAMGVYQRVIAEQYGVCQQLISAILHDKKRRYG